jgi:hypothetical protein
MDKWIKRVAAKLLTITARIARRQRPAVVIDLARARRRRISSNRRPTLSSVHSSTAPKAQHHGSRRGGSDGEARIRP